MSVYPLYRQGKCWKSNLS
ncbi:rCG54668 [Rattus norvegicus]|uniref:RCG54668 n=1 Tax=Rattus norvegicus TaxID=10116 RepID=A6KFN8_RAT|nr:rCG54668 [Rattus norvegicus]